MGEPPVVTIRTTNGTKLAKVVGKAERDGVTVWLCRPRYGKRYSKETIEVTAEAFLGDPPDDV